MHTASYRLLRNHYLHDTDPSQVTRDITSDRTHHHFAMTGGVMQYVMDSRKTQITVQSLDDVAPVEESDVLVISMQAHELILGTPGVSKHNPNINWARLTCCDH
jgi:hypothetical protein